MSTKIPLFLTHVAAGFPSAIDDYMESALDLNELMVAHPAATFFVRVSGDSMKNAGILSGDILVVDRAFEPKDGNIVVAVLNGEFTVKRILKKGKIFFLVPENPSFSPIEVNEEMECQIWGVVTYAIHKV